MKFPVLLLLGMLSLCVVLVVVVTGMKPLSSQSSVGGQYDAEVSCERLVTDALRSPSSATFSGPSDTKTLSISPNVWRINGWVDAQNGFGAQIRNNYECQVRYTGTSWQREALTIIPR